VDPTPLKVEFLPEHKDKSKEELSRLLDGEVDRFSKFMEVVSDPKAAGALTPMERALIKTYLVHKSLGRI
jgi:hypothetical protein